MPVFNFENQNNAFKILAGDFVDTKTGTGIVHMAPAFGEDDFNLCTQQGITIFNPVSPTGKFTKEAGFFRGIGCVLRQTNTSLPHLKENECLFSRKDYRHNLSPLLAVR